MTHPVQLLSLMLLTIAGNVMAQSSSKQPAKEHTRTEFRFTANGSFETVGPLFGAHKERAWAPDWNPQFVYPDPAQDREGMVFQVDHGPYTATWVNTAFDLAAGHMQYAYVLGDMMVTTIDIHLVRAGARTEVTVVYERSALRTEANGHVREFAAKDAKADEEWAAQINRYLSNAGIPGRKSGDLNPVEAR